MIPLPEAAHLLGQGWHRTWSQLLRGELAGEKRDGHWLVSTASVERLAGQRQRDGNRGEAA
jgi:hypothetical protein